MVISFVIIPIGLMLLLNIIIIAVILIKLVIAYNKNRQLSSPKNTNQATFISILAIIGLMIIFNAALTFITVYFTFQDTFFYEVLFSISCIILGLYMFVFYIVLSKDARNSWKESFLYITKTNQNNADDKNQYEIMLSNFQGLNITTTTAGPSNAFQVTDEVVYFNADAEAEAESNATLKFEDSKYNDDADKIHYNDSTSQFTATKFECHNDTEDNEKMITYDTNAIDYYDSTSEKDLENGRETKSAMILFNRHDRNPDNEQGSTIHFTLTRNKHHSGKAQRSKHAAVTEYKGSTSEIYVNPGIEETPNLHYTLSKRHKQQNEETQESKSSTTVLSNCTFDDQIYVTPNNHVASNHYTLSRHTIRLNKQRPSIKLPKKDNIYISIVEDIESKYETFDEGSKHVTNQIPVHVKTKEPFISNQ